MDFWMGQCLICLEPLDTQSLKPCHSFFQEQIIPFPLSRQLSLDCNTDLAASQRDRSQCGVGRQVILDLVKSLKSKIRRYNTGQCGTKLAGDEFMRIWQDVSWKCDVGFEMMAEGHAFKCPAKKKV